MARSDSELRVTFGRGKRVDVEVGDFVVHTDQPEDLGGEGSAPAPFDLFQASLAACAGVYVLGFCQLRGLPTDGVTLTQRLDQDPDSQAVRVAIDIHLPPGFPEKYHDALVRVASKCLVKKVIAAQPEFVIQTRPAGHSQVGAPAA